MLSTKYLRLNPLNVTGWTSIFSRLSAVRTLHHHGSVRDQTNHHQAAAPWLYNGSNMSTEKFQNSSHKTFETPIASLQQSQENKEYICPSRLLEQFSELVILDKATTSTSSYDLPMIPALQQPIIAPNLHDNEVIEPPPGDLTEQSRAKHCKFGIMKIRRLKMKKHKKKKLLKKMYFTWKRMKDRREARELIEHKKELAAIEKTGLDFDATSYVEGQLMKARRGGYYINVFDSSKQL